MDTANYNLNLCGEWKFHLGDFIYEKAMIGDRYHRSSKAGGALTAFVSFTDDTVWKNVNVPHDWLTEQPFDETEDGTGGCKKRGTAWYKKTFFLPENSIETAELVFDGVLGQSVIYVNGVVAARNFSGYNRFSCEIGDYLLAGQENEICVYVDARRWEGWWYEGAGIYRSVYIRFRKKLKFSNEDCFLHTQKTEDGWNIVGELKLNGNFDDSFVKLVLKEGDTVIKTQKIDTIDDNTIAVVFNVKNPKLWTPETPNLYTVESELYHGGNLIDVWKAPIGFRKIEWIAEQGMLLNGNRYQVKGICCHQDHTGLGAAVMYEVEEYRILRLKTLGANAYRCAHHAPSESLLEICDRLGMFVMVENRHFCVNEDTLRQVDALVKLSRNHPSVFLYSLFNEEPWQAEERGKRMAEKLRERVRSLDSTRAVTAAQNGGMLTRTNSSDSLDVIGINYNLKRYEECHNRSPEKVILGTENSPTFATRGVYKTDTTLQVFADYGYEYPKRFSQSLNETMDCMKNAHYAAGCFIWSGFDHRGEPNPYEYPSVASHWGFLDSCGFDKGISYWLRAYYCEKPFVKLIPHWNWTDDEIVRVCAFTNTEKAELFLNGKSLGEKSVVDCRAEWDVVFEVGNLSVVAEKGSIQVKDEVYTVGKAEKLVCEEVTPKTNRCTSRILNISVADEKGNLIPDFNEKLSFKMKKGEVLGVGNGNPNGHHADCANTVPFFNGKAQVVVSYDVEDFEISCLGLPTITLRRKNK